MTLRIVPILYLIFFISLPVSASMSRFRRILKLYEGKIYSARDRDFFMQGNYDSQSDDHKPDSLSFDPNSDRIQTFHRQAQDNIGIDAKKYWGDSLRSRERHFDIGIRGEYSDSSYKRSNPLLGQSDINEDMHVDQRFYSAYSFNIKNYMPCKRNQHYWFYGADAAVSADAREIYSKHDCLLALSGDGSPVSSVVKQISGDGNVSFVPYIGLGRQKPVTPVYQAFEIERAMRETGMIHGELSDATMVAIAEWMATRFALQNTRDLPDKVIFAGLDSILIRDSTVVQPAINGHAVLRIKERVDRIVPWFTTGLELSIGFYEELHANYYKYKDNSSFEYPHSKGIEFYQDNGFGTFIIKWGLPLSDRWFVRCNTSWDPLINTSDGFDDMRNPLFLTWNGALYYLVTDRSFFNLAFNSLPCVVIVPVDQPYQVELGYTYFIEDRVSVNVTFDRYYRSNRGNFRKYFNPYVRYETSTNSFIEEKVNLKLNYDF